jgi:hypothetical protein
MDLDSQHSRGKLINSSATSDSEYDLDDDGSDNDRGPPERKQSRKFMVVGVFSTFEDASAAFDNFSSFAYPYDTRYLSAYRLARVYRCRPHDTCDHRLKVVCEMLGEELEYRLEEGGCHSRGTVSYTRRGIHPSLRGEVNGLLKMGWGARRLRSLLLHRYAAQPDVLETIPSGRQLENRKAYLVRNSAGGWDLRDFARFNALASMRQIASRSIFFRLIARTTREWTSSSSLTCLQWGRQKVERVPRSVLS